MKRHNSLAIRSEKSSSFQRGGPNWVLIAGGALISTLSVRLGFKLRQILDSKQGDDANSSRGSGKSSTRRKTASPCRQFRPDGNTFFNCEAGNDGTVGLQSNSNGPIVIDPGSALPLVTVTSPGYSRENIAAWTASPDRLELPPKPFHLSNCSESPCVSESGSDIFSKREVIQKLRQQLKRRDDMIIEMQDQIAELQNSWNTQLEQSSQLQAQLDAINRDLFNSQREVQRLRKVIADHYVGQEKTASSPTWPPEARNGHANGFLNGSNEMDPFEKGRAGDKVEMLRKEVSELKAVIEGKDFLLQSYKEQKSELSLKVMELQMRLDSQLPNIL
ncbi:hypothetical protein MLD38_019247 [Melastoma candidum]|uniref:Uncharacterized protein n=1 Tax=Melastoma candidum TaxID=119954 RepID=A0ACB9QYA7_9MYRT|nr:hypothetical protein MLD38_019247 [Melastoma candidum]